jgi:Domain of unknown function (DUF4276)
MKVGIVVDGNSEFAGLPKILPRLTEITGDQYLTPVKADIQPYAPVGVIVRQCIRPVRQYLARGVTRVIVLVDREANTGCPGDLANEIGQPLAAATDPQVSVVVKNRTFENWVVADVNALRACPGRFEVSRRLARAVRNNADHVDALTLLKRAVKTGGYDKVQDAKRVLAKADPLTIGANSRSFRRFLRVAECQPYLRQSQNP